MSEAKDRFDRFGIEESRNSGYARSWAEQGCIEEAWARVAVWARPRVAADVSTSSIPLCRSECPWSRDEGRRCAITETELPSLEPVLAGRVCLPLVAALCLKGGGASCFAYSGSEEGQGLADLLDDEDDSAQGEGG
jgi:hypothetical protein